MKRNIPRDNNESGHTFRALGETQQLLSCKTGRLFSGDACPDCGMSLLEILKSINNIKTTQGEHDAKPE